MQIYSGVFLFFSIFIVRALAMRGERGDLLVMIAYGLFAIAVLNA